MMYGQKYSANDLFDMFANQADATDMARVKLAVLAQRLNELAPDMEDAAAVAESIRETARVNSLAHVEKRIEKRHNLIKW